MRSERKGEHIRAEISWEELSSRGISKEDFRSGSGAAKLFISVLAEGLRREGLMERDTEHRVTVAAVEGGIRVSFTPTDCGIRVFEDYEKLVSFLRQTSARGEVYLYRGRCCLLNEQARDLGAAKIREHGTLLCHAPAERVSIDDSERLDGPDGSRPVIGAEDI